MAVGSILNVSADRLGSFLGRAGTTAFSSLDHQVQNFETALALDACMTHSQKYIQKKELDRL